MEREQQINEVRRLNDELDALLAHLRHPALRRAPAAARRKAIAALAVPALTWAAARYGLHLTDAQIIALVSIVTGVTVHGVPNGGAQ